MARVARRSNVELVWEAVRYGWDQPWTARFRGGVLAVLGAGLLLSLATYDASDPSFNAVSGAPASNALGGAGAVMGITSGSSVVSVGAGFDGIARRLSAKGVKLKAHGNELADGAIVENGQ